MPELSIHSINSPDGFQELHADEVDQDIRITLSSATADEMLTWEFSRMFPLSPRRPWDLVARKWTSLSVTADGRSLRLVGIGDGLETKVECFFRGRLLEVRVEWTCLSAQPMENAAVALALDLHHDCVTERVTFPQIVYNGNPSADPEALVPLFGKKRGDCLLCEETRFPVPCVNVEWLQNDAPLFISLFSMPDPDDADWSLGCARTGLPLQALCASGLLALNGRKDHCYGAYRESVPFEGGYRALKKGDRLRKDFFIEFGHAEQVGWGFRSIVRTGHTIFRPEVKPILSLDQVIELKANALRNRWRESADAAGFTCVLPNSVYEHEPYFLYGWTGQNLMLAWCAAKLGFQTGDHWLPIAGLAIMLTEKMSSTISILVG